MDDRSRSLEVLVLSRLARGCFVHRRIVVIAWILGTIGLLTLSSVAGGGYSTDFSQPGTESQEAFDLLAAEFPAQSGDTGQAVFEMESGINDPATRARIAAFLEEALSVESVRSVVSPLEEPLGRVSADGRIAYADIQFSVDGPDVPLSDLEILTAMRTEASVSGLRIEYGGLTFTFAEQEPPGQGEIVGLIAAMVILLLAFGSLLAMILPIVTALFGIAAALAMLTLSANVISVPFFAPQIAAMIGIGVGIDYALFIVTRYRAALRDGLAPQDAIVLALTTSGRAVVFAGLVVVVSLLGILLMGFAFVQGIAVGGATAVAMTLLASVTLLPALIGFAGKNIDRFTVGRRRGDDGHGFWYRWSRLIQRRPLLPAIAGLLALLLLAAPLLDLRIGVSDAGNGPDSRTTRRAYDLISEGFGPGFNGPFLLVADLSAVTSQPDVVLAPILAALRTTPGVVAVAPPVVNASGSTAIITMIPSTSPQAVETSELLVELRTRILPRASEGTGVRVLAGGITPIFDDFATRNAERLPILILVVVGVSFLLLMLVFRSIVVPLKAAIMNILGIGAAYGVIVAIFQWGWLSGFFGVTPGPIEAWAPMMLFVILFGLSMDYEIFLLSRIREEYQQSGDNGEAVANGLAHTARVITAAAAIMIAVFGSFVFGFDDRPIKLFGMGLAVAIFIDATLIRMVLVPATMELLGDANWWMPKWLGRILPRIDVEGPKGS